MGKGLTIVIVLLAGYFIGAKFPVLARTVGL